MPARRFTPREMQIIGAVARGLSNKEVGAELGITPDTVKVYVSRIKAKDPAHSNRHLLVMHLLRDHERVRAIALSEWIKKWGDQLPEESRAEIRALLAAQVSDVLK